MNDETAHLGDDLESAPKNPPRDILEEIFKKDPWGTWRKTRVYRFEDLFKHVGGPTRRTPDDIWLRVDIPDECWVIIESEELPDNILGWDPDCVFIFSTEERAKRYVRTLGMGKAVARQRNFQAVLLQTQCLEVAYNLEGNEMSFFPILVK